MRCEKCKKNAATVHMQQSINGMKKDIYLCDGCSGEIEMSLLLENIFHGIFSKAHANSNIKSQTAAQPKCSNCGVTFDELKKDGILGCAVCYTSFNNILEPLLMNAHVSTSHEGKLPKRTGIHIKRERQVHKLRAHMQQAVEAEDFDRAAFIRDQIRRLDEQPEHVDNENESEKL